MKTIKNNIFYLILLALLFPWLTSCTTITPLTPSSLPISWKERQSRLQTIKAWNIQGVIAVQAAHNNGSATFYWQQTNQNYTLTLLGPLGIGSIQLHGQPGKIILKNAQGQEYQARSAEQLLREQTGWNLPITPLYYWIRGLPAPGPMRNYKFDIYHRIIQFEQMNWLINFKKYGQFRQVELPTTIELLYPGLRVKLIIYQWL